MAMKSKINCSFCNKDYTQVIKLIQGQSDVFICNECIDICNDTINSTSNNSSETRFGVTEQQMFCAVLQNYDRKSITKMQEWLDENEISTWTKISNEIDSVCSICKIMFENESDLVAFKLRWI